jgi:hypothetical protein
MANKSDKIHFGTGAEMMQKYCTELIDTIFAIEKETGAHMTKKKISALKSPEDMNCLNLHETWIFYLLRLLKI